jgi:hypothetical protein
MIAPRVLVFANKQENMVIAFICANMCHIFGNGSYQLKNILDYFPDFERIKVGL